MPVRIKLYVLVCFSRLYDEGEPQAKCKKYKQITKSIPGTLVDYVCTTQEAVQPVRARTEQETVLTF